VDVSINARSIRRNGGEASIYQVLAYVQKDDECVRRARRLEALVFEFQVRAIVEKNLLFAEVTIVINCVLVFGKECNSA